MIALHNSSNMSSAFDEVLSGKARQGAGSRAKALSSLRGFALAGCNSESVSHWLAQSARRVVTIDADIVHLGYTPEILQTRQKDAQEI